MRPSSRPSRARANSPQGTSKDCAMTKAPPTLDATLLRIAEALERLSPPPSPEPRFNEVDAFIWHAEENRFLPVALVNRTPIALLKSVDRMRDTLLANTESFAR